MQANLRRTRRMGMKGEKRVAAAMLVVELASAEELCGVLEVKVYFRLRQNS
jgi:hypothetical protein